MEDFAEVLRNNPNIWSYLLVQKDAYCDLMAQFVREQMSGEKGKENTSRSSLCDLSTAEEVLKVAQLLTKRFKEEMSGAR